MIYGRDEQAIEAAELYSRNISTYGHDQQARCAHASSNQ